MHHHISAFDFLVTAAYVVIFAFIWKLIAFRLSDSNPFKGAMLTLFD